MTVIKHGLFWLMVFILMPFFLFSFCCRLIHDSCVGGWMSGFKFRRKLSGKD